MPAMESILGNATAPGAVATNVTPATGNSLTVRSYPEKDDSGKLYKAHLVSLWARTQAAGEVRVLSPRMHDFQQGIRLGFPAASALPLLPQGLGQDQPLESQDNLTVTLKGSAVGGQIEGTILTIYYEKLPGSEGNFIDPQTLHLNADQVSGNLVACNPTGAGGWTGQRTLNFSQQTINANRRYAVLGMTFDVPCIGGRIAGIDTGNLGLAVPGEATFPHVTGNWFVLMSQYYGVPMIPVINGSNAGSTFVDVAQNQAGAAVNVSVILQRLR